MLLPLLLLRQRSSPAALTTLHDVLDAGSGRRLGSLRGNALTTFFGSLGAARRWEILDDQERVAGAILEEGGLLRRIFSGSASFRIVLGTETVAVLESEFGLLRRRFWLTLLRAENPIDPRFAVA